MAKQRADVESGAGVFAAIVTFLVTKVREKGGDVGACFHWLAKPEGASVLDKIADLIVQAGQGARNNFKVVIDYSLSLADMIVVGKYNYANSDISQSKFPVSGNGKQNIVVELVHYGRDMATDDVLKDLESKGMHPAILPELLAFGATYPEKQREFPIFALGSVWQFRDGVRYVPVLDRVGSLRKLYLHWDGGRWSDDCRFAAVRK